MPTPATSMLDTAATPLIVRGSRLVERRDRSRFSRALAAVLLAHALLIAALIGFEPEPIGDPDGTLDGIAVDMVDAPSLDRQIAPPEARDPADLAGPLSLTPQSQPSPRPGQAQQQPQPTPQQEPQQAQPPTPAQQTAAATPPAPPAPPAPARQQGLSESDIASILALSKTGALERAPAAQPQQQSPKAQPKAAAQPQGGGVDISQTNAESSEQQRFLNAVSKSSIAHAGKVNEYVRAVIFHLARNKPPSLGFKGRVSIELVLTPAGEIESLKLVQSSRRRELDEVVLDRVRSLHFIPSPPGTAAIDRRFDINYDFR